MNDSTVLKTDRVTLIGGKLTVAFGPSPRTSIEITRKLLVVGRNAGCDLVLDDAHVSGAHLDVVASELGVLLRDLGSRNGTWANGLRVREVLLTARATITIGDTVLEFEPTAPTGLELPSAQSFGGLTGAAPSMRELFADLSQVAPTELSVLLLGESGVGKECAAHAIHAASPRAAKPFVVIDCGSITASLAESALFGHERGAFTGAVDKRVSPFVRAEGGTIFLDELGELPADIQPKLLRVLAEKRIQSVGGNSERAIDVRFIAATRRNLAKETNEGRFRIDLFFRIRQCQINIPPLRARREDIPALVRNILAGTRPAGAEARLIPGSFERLMRHDWPGNVRELVNVVHAAVALAGAGPVDFSKQLALASAITLPAEAREAEQSELARTSPKKETRTYDEAKLEFELSYIGALYEQTGGNLAEMGRIADRDRTTLKPIVDRLGLKKKPPNDPKRS